MFDENQQNFTIALTQYMRNETSDEENDSSFYETDQKVEQVGTLETADSIHPIYKQTTIVIGRDPSKSQIVLSDLTVSAQHAKIVTDDQGRMVITDLQSLNGTMMDGKRLRADKPFALVSRKVLMFGRVSVIFTSTDEDRNIGVHEAQNPQLQLTLFDLVDPVVESVSSLSMVNQQFQPEDDLNNSILDEQHLQSIMKTLFDPTYQLPELSSSQIASMEYEQLPLDSSYTSPYDCDSNDTTTSELSFLSSVFSSSDSVNESGYNSPSLLSPPEIPMIENVESSYLNSLQELDLYNSSNSPTFSNSVFDICKKEENESNEDSKLDIKFSQVSFNVSVRIETLSLQVLSQYLGTQLKVEDKKKKGRRRRARKIFQSISSAERDAKSEIRFDELPKLLPRGCGSRFNLRSTPRVDYYEMDNPADVLPTKTRRRAKKLKNLSAKRRRRQDLILVRDETPEETPK